MTAKTYVLTNKIVMIPTTIFLSALLLSQPALAFIGDSTTTFHLVPGRVAVTSVCTHKSLHKARHNRRVTSSSSTSPFTFKFIHYNLIFQSILALSSTTTDNDNERILSEVLELTSSFEQIQETVKVNSRLYEERLVEYEDKIRSLEADVSTSKESIRSKDVEVDTLRKKLEGMERSVEDWGTERETITQRLKGLEGELSENKVQLEEKERELTAALDDRRRSEEELDSSSMEALTIRLEEMEKEATKMIENVAAKSKSLVAMEQSLEEAEKSAEADSRSNEALTVRLQEMEKETTKRKEEIAAKSKTLAVMERSLKEAKTSAESSIAAKEKVVNGLETLVQRKDEAISKLEAEVTNSEKKFQENQRKMIKERDDYKLQRDKLRVEVNSMTRGMRTSRTQDLVKVASKAENQNNELKLKMNLSIKEKDDIIKTLETQIEDYESERDSLRKLTRLGIKRLISLFISLPLWEESYVLY